MTTTDAPLLGVTFDVDVVAEFVLRHGYYEGATLEDIREVLLAHARYGTCMVLMNGGPKNIVAVARWNFGGPFDVTILDAVVHPDHRGKGVVKLMLQSALAAHPWVRTVKWSREAKYPGRKERAFNGPFFKSPVKGAPNGRH